MFRAGFELTGDVASAYTLREAACELLLPRQSTPRQTLEDLNDTSIGHVTVLQIFDEVFGKAPTATD